MAVEISNDAKAVAGAWFGLMGLESKLTFHMVKSRPSARTKAALDELVAAGLVKVEPFNKYGGLVYTPLTDLRWCLDWLNNNRDNQTIKFRLAEPIT